MYKQKIAAGLLSAALITAFSVNTYAETVIPTETEFVCASYNAKKLAAPTNFTAKETSDGIKLSWNKVKGASAYRVYRYNKTLKKYVKLKDVTKLSFEITTVTEKTQKFKVAALTKNEDGDYVVQTQSKAVSITVDELHTSVGTATKLSKPTGLSYTEVTDGIIRLSWNKVKNAAAYRAYIYDSNTKKYKSLKITKKTELNINVSEGTNIFKVAALSVNKKGLYTVGSESDPFTVDYKSVELAKPTGFEYVEVEPENILLMWDEVKNADAYRIWLYNSSTREYDFVQNVKTAWLNISNIPEGTYTFKIGALTIEDDETLTVRSESEPFTVNYTPSVDTSTDNSSVTGSIREVYTCDGDTYELQVGDAISFFHSRTPASAYYAYWWEVEEGEDLIEFDPNDATCKVTARSPGKVVLKGTLQYTMLNFYNSETYSYTHTMTINIVPRTSESSSDIMSWITCPTCGGNETITVGGKERDCPTCGGRGSILR